MAEPTGPRNPFDDPDLRRRVFFTLGALALYRVGTFVPLPGVDAGALQALVDAHPGGPLSVLNALSGGGLARFSLFSLGVIPYVNASILAALVPRAWARQRGETARRLALFLALLQSLGLTLALGGLTAPGGAPVVLAPGWLFTGMTMLTMTAGSLLAMWLCEEITESGIGGGALLVFFACLLGSSLPGIGKFFHLALIEELGLFSALGILIALLAAVMSVIWVETAQRKLSVNYAQRVVGRRMYGGSQSVLPVKLEQSGLVAAVSAAALAASLVAFLLAAAPLLPRSCAALLLDGGWTGDVVIAALIVLFCRFPASAPADPRELADNLKKSGGSIQGVRPGDATIRHIQRISERLAFDGAVFVAALAVLPDLLRRILRLPVFFDGLPLLIIVGVALDAMGRVEAHGIRRTYAKYLKK